MASTSKSTGKEVERKEFVINIPPYHDLVDSDQQWRERYIYRVPKKLRNVNEEAYTPKLVSIGPLHSSLELSEVKLQKQIYLKKFSIRTGKSQQELASIIEGEKENIGRSYSETFPLDEKFVEMILLDDAIFIIELFMRYVIELKKYEKEDYILSNAWLEFHIKQDLILLENQLPFTFLKKFYESAFNGKEVPPFLKLTCQFFFSGKYRIPTEVEIKHFTDLQRMHYRPTDLKPDQKPTKRLRYTATKLYEAGLEFEAVELDFSKRSLLGVDFAKDKRLERYPCFNLSWLFSCLPCLKSFGCLKGVQCILKVPVLEINDTTEALFRNLMALEQCHYPSNTYICNYVLLLDSLITTTTDVRLLVEKGAIENRRGSSDTVTSLINTLGHMFVEPNSCYNDLYLRLNDHCDNLWNRLMQSLTSAYCGDFWRGTATVAGILVLAFTFGNFIRPFLMKF